MGVSQSVIENEYYTIDLPKLIELKRKKEVSEKLINLQLMIAANNRAIEEDGFNELIRNLTKNLEEEKEMPNKLDRHKIEALRLMTNTGANRTN